MVRTLRRTRCFAVLLVTALSAPVAGAALPTGTPPHAGHAAERAFIDALLARMTLEEKLGQLNQPRGLGNDTGPAAQAASEAQIGGGEVGSILGVDGARRTCELQRVAVQRSRLGIPLLPPDINASE
ncbi:MAG TPA: hypothetical protein PLO34_03495, partial [Pseudoxanthomonas sp.]|nr:hypothetical protein [Pseudoxanthomonas sp.]